jgi:hypothetical protein
VVVAGVPSLGIQAIPPVLEALVVEAMGQQLPPVTVLLVQPILAAVEVAEQILAALAEQAVLVLS